MPISGLWPGVVGVLILVCDQPLLRVEHLAALLQRHTAGNALVTASFYSGKAGVPAVFASQLFPQVMSLHGDQGARELIRGPEGQVETIGWPEGAVDIDRPEDLETAGAQ
jgi:molybdenum cofactor cytidylyltransferase